MHAKQAKATMADIAALAGRSMRLVREDRALGVFSMDDFWSVSLYVVSHGLVDRQKNGEPK